MNSNENTPLDTVTKLNNYLEEDEKARWLADVYCIWDQDLRSWAAGTPVLIRTELRDVLLSWPDGAHLHIDMQPVDIYDEIKEDWYINPATNTLSNSHALCWRRRPCMAHFVGSSINRFVFVPASAGDELFVYFINGESMRIAATRIVSHMLLSAA